MEAKAELVLVKRPNFKELIEDIKDKRMAFHIGFYIKQVEMDQIYIEWKDEAGKT